MAVIAWSNSTPGTDMTASAVDDQFRSDWSSIETGLKQWIYWTDGSATSDGEWKQGTFRLPMMGANEVRGGPNIEGYLAWEDGGQTAVGSERIYDGGIYHSTSGASYCVGHAFMQEQNSHPGLTARWQVSQGTIGVSLSTSAATTGTITYGVTYDIAPRVFLTIARDTMGLQANDYVFYGLDAVSTATAISSVSWKERAGVYPVSTVSEVILAWRSEGTVSY